MGTSRSKWMHHRGHTAVMAVAAMVATAAAGACSAVTTSDVATATSEAPATTGSAAATTVAGADTTVDMNNLRSCFDSLDTNQRAGQVLWALTSRPDTLDQAAADGLIGGVGALEDQGSDIADQLAAVADGPRVPMAFASDEEGGTVQRLDKVIEPLPAARDTTDTMSTAEVRTMWSTYASKMVELGFTANFAPVLDVGFGPALVSRSYALDPQVVIDFTGAAMAGMQEGGIAPIAKHFPGIGYATADPHGQLITVGPLDTLESREFLPFEAAIEAGVPAIMTTHAVIPGVTGGEPVTMSEAGVALLRDDLGFDGLIVTDSLSMGAIVDERTQPEAAVQALVAGNDVALIAGSDNVEPAHAAIVAAVEDGTLSEDRLADAVRHVLDFKGVDGTCPAEGASTTLPAVVTTAPASSSTVLERDPVAGGTPTDG